MYMNIGVDYSKNQIESNDDSNLLIKCKNAIEELH